MPPLETALELDGAPLSYVSVNDGSERSTSGNTMSSMDASTSRLSNSSEQMVSASERKKELERPPRHFKDQSDIEMWYFQKGLKVEKIRTTECTVARYARTHVFRFIKFVDDEEEFLKPDTQDTDISAFTILSEAMGWRKGEERVTKWNTYGRTALVAIRQARSQAVSKIMTANIICTID